MPALLEENLGLYKRGGTWWFSYVAHGKQVRESSRTVSKRVAECLLAKRKTEVLEGRWNLPRSDCPRFQQWADEVIASVVHANTRSRYCSNAKNLVAFFGDAKLSEITADQIGEFQRTRLARGKSPATVNRDIAFLFRLLKLARKRRFIMQNPCEEADRLNERHARRQARPLSYDEEKRLLSYCGPLLRIFVIVLIETGLRSKKEALPLKWRDVDVLSTPGSALIRHSKTPAGARRVWLTEYCRQQLLLWRPFTGQSEYVFPSPRNPRAYWTGYQLPWKDAVSHAGLGDRRVYDLRSTFASRANATRANTLTLAQLLGHANTSILPTYVKQLDENTRAVIHALDELRDINFRTLSSGLTRLT